MINLTKRFLTWLKNIFKGESMSYEFPTFKVEAIEAAINIKDHATTDGKNNLPRTNSRTFSNCENELPTTREVEHDASDIEGCSVENQIFTEEEIRARRNYIEDFG